MARAKTVLEREIGAIKADGGRYIRIVHQHVDPIAVFVLGAHFDGRRLVAVYDTGLHSPSECSRLDWDNQVVCPRCGERVTT